MYFSRYYTTCTDPCCKPKKVINILDGECYTVERTTMEGIPTFKIVLDYECINNKIIELQNIEP